MADLQKALDLHRKDLAARDTARPSEANVRSCGDADG
jgi:hypothetical protein